MGNTSLQELSKAYAEGKLEQQGYRKKRTELMDSVTNPTGIEQFAPNNSSSNTADINAVDSLSPPNNATPNYDPELLISNRSPVLFLLIVTAVLLTFVYVLIIM